MTISSDISKAVGEYERFVATLINSYVGPVTSTYLHGVQDRLADVGFAGELHIMQCHGGMVPLGLGADRPIFTIGSGPVGGLIGCARVADDLGRDDIIASDMGGTSFDVGIIKDGEPLAADDTLLGKWRYRVPAVEVISIGAGGGSIAWIDELGGGLRVGPQSASSLPGPACYDRGGEEPTVTDADLILGYIAPEATFGSKGERGGFKPRRDLAEKAIVEKIADPLGLSRHRRRARHRRGRQREDGQRRWRTRSSAAASTRATSSSCPTAAPAPSTPPATRPRSASRRSSSPARRPRSGRPSGSPRPTSATSTNPRSS